MTLHRLKTWPVHFERLVSREKTFEVRKNDRDFQVGDLLDLVEWDPTTRQTMGRMLRVEVMHLTSDPMFFQPGYVAMSIRIMIITTAEFDAAIEEVARAQRDHETIDRFHTVEARLMRAERALLKAGFVDEDGASDWTPPDASRPILVGENSSRCEACGYVWLNTMPKESHSQQCPYRDFVKPGTVIQTPASVNVDASGPMQAADDTLERCRINADQAMVDLRESVRLYALFQDEVWHHARCLSIAEQAPGWETPVPNERPAAIAVRKLVIARNHWRNIGAGYPAS